MSLRDFYDQLARTPGVGPQRVATLMKAGLTIQQITTRHAQPRPEDHGQPFLTPACADYPVAFHQLSDPPLRLFCRGVKLDLLSRPIVGVVGSRRASRFALSWAQRLGSALARNGASVCSGLALGIDGAVHRGVLEEMKRNPQAAKPVAVLGHGWNFTHPSENRSLFDELKHVGLLLTEYPPDQAPTRWTFPARNRLIAALSDHVVVVEAGQKSGSLHTARFAEELGRKVWAVPTTPGRANSKGVLALLRDGANAIYDLEEFVEEIVPTRRRDLECRDLKRLEPKKRQLLELLVESEGEVDILYQQTNYSPVELAYQLTELEIDGLLRRTLDGRWEPLCWDLLSHLS